jgi:hypothetical protein
MTAKNGTALTREALLGAAPQTQTVELKSGVLAGQTIVIRGLSRGARKAWTEAIAAGDLDATEVLVIESLVEPKLERKDIAALGAVDEKLIDEIVGAIAEYNGWVKDDAAAAAGDKADAQNGADFRAE